MNAGATIATLSGFMIAALGVGALTLWQSEPLAAAEDGEWRPPCVQRLHRDFRTIDVSVDGVDGVDGGDPRADAAASPTAAAQHTILFGVDRSPSNREVADEQLDAVVAHTKGLPLDIAAGVLLISDRSDRSSTPDMPIEAARRLPAATIPPLPCAPDCQPRSLFEQHCYERLEEALETRAASLADASAARRQELEEERALRIDAWVERAKEYTPKPGTSLLAFFAKVSDLPPVLSSPARTTLVVLSDLEEARTGDRRKLEGFYAKYRAKGEICPEVEWLPSGLSGLDVVLLQTHTDGINAELWGQRWEALLGCAGAHVRRQRYSAAVSLGDYLAPSLAGLAEAPTADG